ncbi:MAG: serine--tRNA ligase [Alphaproteobacteria bacterium]|nr:serine--tRNA ligase [Alphaproteobacteria bacterium]
MLDLKWIREQPDALNRALLKRQHAPRGEVVQAIDKARRDLQTRLQELQSERNRLSKEIGAAKAKKLDAADLMNKVAALKEDTARLEEQERAKAAELEALLAVLPNVPDDSVPEGKDETANVEVRRDGTPRKFAFQPKEHAEIGAALGLMDFDAAARMSGARFVVLKGALARLERALGAFMLDLQTGEHGYSETNVPHLVRDEAMVGTGQLPKFAEDLFKTTIGNWLIPTAEVSLTNLVREQILDEAVLPVRLTACTPCYRSEAGAAGKDTTGMIRQHQFTKVELVSITRAEDSDAEHERMTQCAEEVLKRLELPYRTMLLCTGDMGFSSRKTYDIEVWLPGQDRYREISSCSNCGDFQARRMNARYRPKGDEKGTRFVHTLNGSGLAVGRTLIAVLENYQNADGSVTIPAVLRPYMGGQSLLTAQAIRRA